MTSHDSLDLNIESREAASRLRGAGTDHAPLAFEIRPAKAFGFGKAPTFSQTRWLW